MRKLLFSLVLALPITQTGCIKSMLTNGQISATRKASPAFQTIGDYELARSAAMAGLVQFEGMHQLAPTNEDALFLLLRGWTGYSYAFAWDDWEQAIDAGDDEAAEYQRDSRARAALDRAIGYGKELLKNQDEGFEAAKKNDASIKAWLKKHFDDKEDAELVYWFGAAWLLRVQLLADNPAFVAELFVGVAFLEHARRLDPALEHYASTANLAAYHARSGMAELDLSKQMFEEALAKTQRKSLMVQFNYAARYACVKSDRALYEKLLNEVLDNDPDPQQALPNAVAKRRAKRYLGRARMMECGFDVSSDAGAGKPAATDSAQAPGAQPAAAPAHEGAAPPAGKPPASKAAPAAPAPAPKPATKPEGAAPAAKPASKPEASGKP